VTRMVDEFNERRRIVLQGIEDSPGLTSSADPKGAFYVFVKHDVPAMNTSELADHLLDKGGVAVVPGTSFGTRGDGYLRISYATSSQNCREGMERIAHAMALLGR
jgi:aspartate aminotransferase